MLRGSERNRAGTYILQGITGRDFLQRARVGVKWCPEHKAAIRCRRLMNASSPGKQRSLMARLALGAIVLYQRYLSPVKGFSCAYRVLTGRDSCSAYGYRVIARHGLRRGASLLQRRLHACGEQHRLHLARQQAPRRMTARHRAQAGDCACDLPCDLPGADCLGNACDASDVLECCDWPARKKKNGQS